MAKKPKHRPIVISAGEIWAMRKPRYDGFAIGHGTHKSKKAYDRARMKARLRKELEERASSRKD